MRFNSRWVFHVSCMWVGGFSPQNSLAGTWTHHLKGERFRMNHHPSTYTLNEIQFNATQSNTTRMRYSNKGKQNKATHSKTKPINPQQSISTSDTNNTKCTHNYHKTTKSKTRQRKERKSKAQRHKAKQNIARDGSQRK